jgi:hypothetical protein
MKAEIHRIFAESDLRGGLQVAGRSRPAQSAGRTEAIRGRSSVLNRKSVGGFPNGSEPSVRRGRSGLVPFRRGPLPRSACGRPSRQDARSERTGGEDGTSFGTGHCRPPESRPSQPCPKPPGPVNIGQVHGVDCAPSRPVVERSSWTCRPISWGPDGGSAPDAYV